MLGLGFSNYSGISGKNINPAFLVGSKIYLDVNIASVSIFLENNFAYIPKDSAFIGKFFRGEGLPTNYGAFQYNNFYNYYQDKRNYSFASVITVMGPSLMVQDGKHAFGVGIAFRNMESFNNFPGRILRTWYNGAPDKGIIGIDSHPHNFQVASLSWNELFFDYAFNFYERYGNKLTAGIEMKVLFGIEGFYTSVDDLKYHWINKYKIKFDTLSATVGFALPLNYDNFSEVNLSPWAKGHGVGMNIGIMYTKDKSTTSVKSNKPLCANPYEDYQYRIGLSILDIGGIRFDRFARLYQSNIRNVIITPDSFNNDFTLNSIIKYFDPLISQSSKDAHIFMSLPTAFSLQFDYHFKKNVYLSGFWIHPLRFQTKSLRRPAQLALIPRYETRLVGVSLPFSWYDYQKIRLGLAVRLYTITIGTEKLGAFLGISDFNGMDFYFNIKFNLLKGRCSPWKWGACQKAGKSKRK